MSKVMSVNAGSSSLKFQLYEMPEETVLAKGLIERIGLDKGHFKMSFGDEVSELTLDIPDHEAAVDLLIEQLLEKGIVKDLKEIEALGHRIVHGGEYYSSSIVADRQAEENVEACAELAPLHNPAGLIGYRTFKKALPQAVHTFVFDTAFHQSMPEQSFLYPIPYELYQNDGIRRYGFHGTSHNYLRDAYAKEKGIDVDEVNIITCHLGNGGSITAIKDGKSYKTSMGLTPMAGIMMGTRSGDIDPSILPFLQKKHGCSAKEVEDLLNKQSGLLGISQVSSDMRDVEQAASEGNALASLALDLFKDRVIETVGGYYALMNGADAIVFSGGIGENDQKTRKEIVQGLEALGVILDEAANENREKKISAKDSKIEVFVIPTDEEVMLARDAYKGLQEQA